MDAQILEMDLHVNIVDLESGTKLIWVGDKLDINFFTVNNITFGNILRRVEEMNRYGVSVHK